MKAPQFVKKHFCQTPAFSTIEKHCQYEDSVYQAFHFWFYLSWWKQALSKSTKCLASFLYPWMDVIFICAFTVHNAHGSQDMGTQLQLEYTDCFRYWRRRDLFRHTFLGFHIVVLVWDRTIFLISSLPLALSCLSGPPCRSVQNELLYCTPHLLDRLWSWKLWLYHRHH